MSAIRGGVVGRCLQGLNIGGKNGLELGRKLSAGGKELRDQDPCSLLVEGEAVLFLVLYQPAEIVL
mgnify:CR=1 FL=1